MPYITKKNGSQWCVFKKGASKPIKGGCHSTKSAADKHRDALNINVSGEALYEVHAATQSRQVTFTPLEAEPLLSTVYNVDVCAVGIEYPLASGPATFTPEDLIEAVASQSDTAIKSPRVWLGHPDDDRFHAGRATPAGSAEPALGKIINMRVEDNGMTLVGDIEGCPTWLAKILSSAYPNRSIEGFQGATTVTGHEWKLVITDMALLGVTWPGVSTLDDLESLFSEDGPEGVEVKEEDMSVAAARAITAQVNVDDVRRAFYNEALGEMDISPWSWIRAIQLDPNEIIIDDDEGHLFRASFETSGENVTFGDPAEVKIKYVNAEMMKAYPHVIAASMMVAHEGVLFANRAESRPDHINQEVRMTPEQLRASIGLPADATDDQVRARMAELQAAVPSPDQVPDNPEPAAPGPGPVPATADPSNPSTQPTPANTTPDSPSPDQLPTGPDVLNPDPVQPPTQASVLPPGMTAVPTAAWQAMQANVQALAAKSQADETEGDMQLLATACRKGKVFPAQRAYYEARLKDAATRDTFRHLLTADVEAGGLAENLVPVEARGIDPSTTGPVEAYPADWLPEVAAQTGDTTVTMEQR